MISSNKLMSLTKIFNLTFFIAAFIILQGCKKEEETSQTDLELDLNTPSDKSVYICGYEINDIGNTVAKYWKDGEEVVLSNGSTDAIGRAIWVAGDDVYVAGSRNVSDAGSQRVPVYWKNGIELALSSDPSTLSTATDIYVDGTAVYIVGYEKNADGVLVAKLYGPGGTFDLSDGVIDARAEGVFVENGNVHVVGYQNVSETNSTAIATYWLNGVVTPLENNGNESMAIDVEVKNGDVYICGNVQNDSGTNMKMLWINGNQVNSTGGLSTTIANGMFIDGDDVYVAGTVDGSGCISGYWKNENFTSLCPMYSSPNVPPTALNIAVDGSDIYVTGSGSDQVGTGIKGVYWKNGEAFTLGSTPYQDGLYDVFLK
jgi:hypothetical protein